jgi:pimeloyl-ACP methyl ester carboxylesterase
MEKLFIKNRKNQKVSVLVNNPEKPQGLVFVMHGLGGYKEQSHMVNCASAFEEKDYTVVSFDTTNSFGESDGQFEDATITNYYEDLEDVINWSKDQSWYQEPFVLVGHSLGSICILLYAEKYPKEVKALAPTSTVVSWELSVKSEQEGDLKQWQEDGIRIWKGHSGKIKRLKWGFVEDRKQYDALKEVNNLTMPTLLLVGDNDTATLPDHQQILFDKLPGKKEIHIIKGAEHTFREPKHLEEIKYIFLKWIDSL